MVRIICCVILFLLAASEVAEAYIDPGSGGLLVGTLLPIILAFLSTVAAFALKYFWVPITRAFARVFGRGIDREKKTNGK
jgi:uncharacterized BrkB/YihY/UPF0761 family membrane protein